MSTSTPNTPQTARAALTDSPWFWGLVFSVMGLVLLQAFDAKYGRRQAQLERQHQARQRTQLDRADAPQAALDEVQYSADGQPMISLWPVRIVLLLGATVSGSVLWASYRSRGRETRHDVAV